MRITPCPLLLHGLVVLVLLSVASVAGADAMPPGLRVALTKVSSLMEKKQYRTATETLESFRAKNTTVRHAELFFALGNGYLLQNRQAEAVQAYQQTVALDPHHTHGWLNLAKAHYDLKQYREAGRCFGKGYESEAGKHPHNLYYSAAALLMAGAHKEAVVTFERLFAGHARICTPQWKEQYIHALLGAGQTKRALPMIRELAALYTGDQRIQWQEILLYQYVQLNMHREALAFARELTGQNPLDARWWKALVHIQLHADHLEDALAALTIYGYLTPLSAQENKLLADLYLQTGIPAKAAPIYLARLQTEPDRQLLQRLAIAYYQMGQPESALQSISRHKRLADDSRLLMLKGELCYTLKRYAEAASSYRQAAQRKGSASGQAWLMAGYAALQSNDFDASRKAFALAAQHDQEKKAATLALNHLRQMAAR